MLILSKEPQTVFISLAELFFTTAVVLPDSFYVLSTSCHGYSVSQLANKIRWTKLLQQKIEKICGKQPQRLELP